QAFVKVQKTKAYFKRYQVKFRRRREGKTDYRARKRLICQDKNKYNSPKYRLVVRFTNKFVLAQIIYATIQGDVCMCQASSTELPRYGCKVGLKNYAAAYCTGLLVARRLLRQLGLDEADDDKKMENLYAGQGVGVDEDGDDDEDEVDGNVVKSESNGRTYYVDEVDEEKRPFKALLDVGIRSTSTGNRVFGCMKGAADGGLDVPHNEKRFPGYDRDTKQYDAELHRDRIYGAHVAEYMEYLTEEDEAKYKEHFASYIENELTFEDVEDMYKETHKAIREDPSPAAKTAYTPDKSFKNAVKLTYAQRKERVAAKKEEIRAARAAEDE
ncbi:unnamed protein product, partial [Ectocarpus sp. 4 AP-2014]